MSSRNKIEISFTKDGFTATGEMEGIRIGRHAEYAHLKKNPYLGRFCLESVANSMALIKERGKDFFQKCETGELTTDEIWELPENPPLDDFEIILKE